MSQLERVYQIDQMLTGRRVVSRQALLERLEVSWATLKRDLAYMKDRLHAPIVFDRSLGGYRWATPTASAAPHYALPGLWFSAAEIHALLTMQHLLSNLDPGGLLGPHIQPLLSRLTGLLESSSHSAAAVQQRIRILAAGARILPLEHFQQVGMALLQRQRLRLAYHARGSNQHSLREVSPLRLVHYRDNWYLDAWCHWREGLRSFAVDAITQADMLPVPACEQDDATLDACLGAGYGIFSGAQVQWAVLRFSPERARWVAAERWHPQQQGTWLEDGGYELRLPYADDRELMMDVLKHGGDCQVLAPPALRDRVQAELQRALQVYLAPKRT